MTAATMNSAESPPVNDQSPHVYSAAAYLAEFKPIESVVDGLPIPRGGLVALTGPTGHGKTTIAALLEVALARGEPFAGRETSAGTVLVLAGENPDDWAMHLAATLQDQGLTPRDLRNRETNANLAVVPGVFDVTYQLDYLAGVAATHFGPLVAVIVDTSAAFYLADDENSNADQRRHATALRELTTLPGRPAVIVLCHPTKTAQRDNLLPRGGGAFLAELDANLTCWRDDAGVIVLHWAGKIRGANFDPIRFELVPVTLEGRLDCRERPIQSVAARHVADDRAEQILDKEAADEDILLRAMLRRPNASIRELASACGWTGATQKPQVARVDRRMRSLQKHSLVEQDRKGRWRLTTKGQREAEALR